MAIHWTDENASQELVNAWTHGIGFLISLPAAVYLIRLAAEHRPSVVPACVVYCISLSALYLFSTLSHAVQSPAMRHRMRACDQGFVYGLISGTFTPFICGNVDGWLQTTLLCFVWIAAIAGFYSKVVVGHRINNMAATSYVLLGWIPSMFLFNYVTTVCFASMAFGGVLYTIGVLFLQNDHRSWYYHAVWHTMVILASATHFAAIAAFVVLRLDH